MPDGTLQFPVRSLHAAAGGDTPGSFEAVVSTFNTRVEGLFYDQMLKPGCFSRSLTERGLPACVWSHDWDTPPIGVTTEASETPEGLQVKGRLFVADDEDSPLARQVYTAMRATGGDGRHVLREFSIGFDIVEAGWEVHDEDEVLAISEVNLFEYGPCLVGRNVSRLIDVNGHTVDRNATAKAVLGRFPKPSGAPAPKSSSDRQAHRRLLMARPRH